MTLSVRKKIFFGGLAFCTLSLAILLLGGYYAFPAFEASMDTSSMQAGGIANALFGNLAESSHIVPYFAILCAVMYSLAGIILILIFFEKTHSPEILFIGLFIISLSFEFIRLSVPLREILHFPSVYMIFTSRILLFGRYIGLFSLFAAAVYAAGLDIQKQQIVLIMIILASLLIAINIPVNSQIWDSSFKLVNAFAAMLILVETGVIIITIITFFISAWSRGSKTFIYIGLGIFTAFLGRNILLASDSWFTLVPGFLALSIGTWICCTKLHREYLWL